MTVVGDPVYEVRCGVRTCPWTVAANTPDELRGYWIAHREACHLAPAQLDLLSATVGPLTIDTPAGRYL